MREPPGEVYNGACSGRGRRRRAGVRTICERCVISARVMPQPSRCQRPVRKTGSGLAGSPCLQPGAACNRSLFAAGPRPDARGAPSDDCRPSRALGCPGSHREAPGPTNRRVFPNRLQSRLSCPDRHSDAPPEGIDRLLEGGASHGPCVVLIACREFWCRLSGTG